MVFDVSWEVDMLNYRLTDDRRLRKLDGKVSEGVSTWILKSPRSTNSLGIVAARESSEPNSSMKTDCFVE